MFLLKRIINIKLIKKKAQLPKKLGLDCNQSPKFPRIFALVQRSIKCVVDGKENIALSKTGTTSFSDLNIFNL